MTLKQLPYQAAGPVHHTTQMRSQMTWSNCVPCCTQARTTQHSCLQCKQSALYHSHDQEYYLFQRCCSLGKLSLEAALPITAGSAAVITAGPKFPLHPASQSNSVFRQCTNGCRVYSELANHCLGCVTVLQNKVDSITSSLAATNNHTPPRISPFIWMCH